MITLENISRTYESNSGKVEALQETNLTIQQGENAAVVGKSGSGKSTLLNIISGIDRPTGGTIKINNTTLNNLKESQLAQWRGRNIGIVFQFYQLLPTLTAMDNVRFAMEIVRKVPKVQQKDIAISLMNKVGLPDKANKFPSELSGGERQRVAIARALANDPAIIVADEPTGNLDSHTGALIHQIFDKLHQEGKTIIMVTHEDIKHRKFDRLINIKDGILNEKQLTS